MTVFRPTHSGRYTVQINTGHFGSHEQPCDRPYYTTTNAGWSAGPAIYRTALHSAHYTIQNVWFRWFRQPVWPRTLGIHVFTMHWNNDDNDKLGLQWKHYKSEIADFKNNFLNENVWALFAISLKFVRNIPIENKSELAEVLAWCWTGDKPLTEPMMTQFDDAYMRHPTSMSPSVQTKLDCELRDTNYFDDHCVSMRLWILPQKSCLRKGWSGSKL